MKDQLIYVKQGQEALRKATRILENKDGWNVEITESNGDVIYSKVMPGGRRVFRLESVLEADVDELYDILFLRVEEMHKWNPSIQQIKVLKRVGPETVVTHEVSAQTRGNLIGQRDFVSVRHSCKHKTHVYLGGAAIQLESFPPLAGFVRCRKNSLYMASKYGCEGLAAKIHCQSGFAPSTAGFYPTSAEASHSERMPEVTERAPEAAAAASAPCYSQRNHGKPDKTLEEIGPEGIMVWNYRN
ncbi:hypothetical protein fugu_000503 [Takifugu bimaculatus]|uniref:START domain-containing protein 1 n=1 Tax=Takifugu bimaculatus TaxID=433685 RepID=A0A4Z2CHD3_9TELE|nr:hypothetical protein fugu_000503 [Takifugu bimaculatus]